MIATIATYFEKKQRSMCVEHTLAATEVRRRTLFNIRKELRHYNRKKGKENTYVSVEFELMLSLFKAQYVSH